MKRLRLLFIALVLVAIPLLVGLAYPPAFAFLNGGNPISQSVVPLNTDTGVPTKVGHVWYVDQINGNDTNSGFSQSAPFATIGKGLTSATNGAGDIIIVYPGTYAENLSVTKDYITMIGAILGGYARPDVVPAAGIALTVSTGRGFTARHMRFASVDNSDTVLQNTSGFRYEDDVFDGNALQVTKGNLRIVGGPGGTASEGKVLNSYIRGGGAAGILFQHRLAIDGGEGSTDNEIAHCRFVDNVASDLKSVVNTNGGGAGIYINLSVHDNQFMTSGASYKYINFAAGAAGDLAANSCLIANNYFADEALTGGTGNQIDLGAQPKAHFAGNFDDIAVVNGTTFN